MIELIQQYSRKLKYLLLYSICSRKHEHVKERYGRYLKRTQTELLEMTNAILKMKHYHIKAD